MLAMICNFKLLLSSSSLTVHPDAWIRGDHPSLFHHHWETRDPKDALPDRPGVNLQVFLYHHGHGATHHLLRPGRGHPVWKSEIRRSCQSTRQLPDGVCWISDAVPNRDGRRLEPSASWFDAQPTLLHQASRGVLLGDRSRHYAIFSVCLFLWQWYLKLEGEQLMSLGLTLLSYLPLLP